MLFWAILFVAYGAFSAWQVLNQRTMLDLSLKHGYRLSEAEHKIAIGEAKIQDKLKAFPKYFLGFYIQPQMLFFYVVVLIVWFVKFK